MRWTRNLRLSCRALARSPGRTALSILGVAIGIASVVILIGAGIGAERAVREALEPLGHNLLVVNAERTRTDPLRGVSRTVETLTLEDAEALKEIPGVLRAAPVAERPMRARVGGRSVSVRVHGTTAEFERARNFPLVAGRFIDEHDVRKAERVVVVGRLVVDGLFRGEMPLGESILVEEVPFRIIGVTRAKGVSTNGVDEDELVMIPVTSAMSRLLDVESLDRIYVQAESEKAIPAVRDAIEAVIVERHAADDVSIQDQTALVRARQETGGSLSRVVTGLSALTLALGGIGLLAVSLLSVRERHPEIGLRLAVGGRPRDILMQFLVEAIMISVLGGATGLAAGAGGILIGASLTRWPMVLSWEAVVYPLTVSIAIALVFGVYPALRAARLDPIAALNSR